MKKAYPSPDYVGFQQKSPFSKVVENLKRWEKNKGECLFKKMLILIVCFTAITSNLQHVYIFNVSDISVIKHDEQKHLRYKSILIYQLSHKTSLLFLFIGEYDIENLREDSVYELSQSQSQPKSESQSQSQSQGYSQCPSNGLSEGSSQISDTSSDQVQSSENNTWMKQNI